MTQAAGIDMSNSMSLEAVHRALTAVGQPFEIAQAMIRGEPMKVWKNAPPTLRDALAIGRGHGDDVFLVHDSDRVSFAAFYAAVCELARQWRDDGLRKGDRVAIAMRNRSEWPVAFFAAVVSGAIAVPLNAWWTGAELEYALLDCGAVFLVADDERLARIAPILGNCPSVAHIYAAGASQGVSATALDTIIGQPSDWAGIAAPDLPVAALAPDDDATIFYTSGTTGFPKGALGTHRNMMTTLMTGAFIGARGALRDGAAADPGMYRRALLLSVPFFHILGCAANLCPALVGGCKLVLMRKWTIDEGLRLIEQERITDAGGVPTNAIELAEHAARSGRDVSSLTGISYGGAPSRPELVDALATAFPKARPATGWGMTETSGGVAAQLGRDVMLRPASCGVAVPVWEMRIVDEEDRNRPPGETGELLVRGPGLIREYWNKPDATADAFVDGWLRTGDLAWLDEEGFCFLVDRAKDVIIRGGENIYSVEVENVLGSHPAVLEAALIAMPHPLLGEEPAAIVRARPGTTVLEAELQAFARTRLAAFKVPTRIDFRDEPLPRNATGKILKAQLKAELS